MFRPYPSDLVVPLPYLVGLKVIVYTNHAALKKPYEQEGG